MNQRVKSYPATIKQILVISLFATLLSQSSLNFYNGKFIASLGPVCIPLFMYLFDDIKVIAVSMVSASFVYASRLLIFFFQNGNINGSMELYLPEAGFYVIAGILMFLFEQLTCHRRQLYIYVPAMMSIDYLCNELELFARMQADPNYTEFHRLLILIAAVRGMILLVLLISLDKYRVLLFTKSHAMRYHHLIMLISKLSGEVVWLNKNLDKIENTMTTSYKLYDTLKEEGDEINARNALSIAKDIHEIKKEYRLISRGLSETIKQKTEEGMEISEMFNILIQATQNDIADSSKRLFFTLNIENRLYTKDTYLYLSIFRNLVNNALDAAANTCAVHISETRTDDEIIFSFSDSGPGIPAEYVESIFAPHFSTKINYDTGVINRGLGLPIVKDIVEEKLGGTIKLIRGSAGAKFVISIPVARFEVIS